MSFLKKLKKLTPMIAVGATLLTQTAKADESHTEEKAPAPVTQSTTTEWKWKNQADKAVFDSLPREYKAFANKSFDERMMMQEMWEQQDYLARKEKHDLFLKKHPHATIGDLYPDSLAASLPLSDFKIGTFEYSIKIYKDHLAGKLSQEQERMAYELKDFGRPLSTLDPSLSYAEKLAACGFDVFAAIASGQKEHSLSPRDHSILLSQMQVSEKLQYLPENRDSRINLKQRLFKEDVEYDEEMSSFWDSLFAKEVRVLKEGEYTPSPTEEINGKTVFVPDPRNENYSYYEELTRRAAAKIAEADHQRDQAHRLTIEPGR